MTSMIPILALLIKFFRSFWMIKRPPRIPAEKLPWTSIKFLISEVTYGGRVTDDWDRRLLNVYANEYFHDKVLDPEKYKLGNE